MEDQTILERNETIATSIGDVTMRELVIEDVQFIISDLFKLYEGLDKEVLSSGDGFKIFMTAVKSKQLTQCITNMIARSGSKSQKDVAGLGIRDTMKLAKAFIRVNPIKEMTELFLELKEEVLGPPAKEGEEESEGSPT